MARDRRNTRFFFVMIVLLLIVAYYGAIMGGTVDHCGATTPEKWSWIPPPHWICGQGSIH